MRTFSPKYECLKCLWVESWFYKLECIDIMAFGSGPSLILVNCEKTDANSHVCRAGVSVQTQICVSLVINIFEQKR